MNQTKISISFLVLMALVMFLGQECQSQTPSTGASAPQASAPASPSQGGPGAATGSISGMVKLTGTPPVVATLKRQADPFCAKTEMKDETIVVNPNGTLKNVAVRVVKGPVPPVAATPPPVEVVFDQQNCMYRPRVLGVAKGQKVLVRNSDPTMHNIHAYAGTNTLFNRAMMKGAKDIEAKVEPGVNRMKCDVHPWMTGYIVVNENPLISVTGDSGDFTLANLPAGTYTVEAWHEKYGAKSVDVTVTAGQVAKADFAFAPPK